MFVRAYKRAFSVLAKKPFLLWGLSLLSALIVAIAKLNTALVPVVGIGFGFVIEVGMAKVYLDGLEGRKVNSDQLFSGFSRLWRVAGGMAWRMLWYIIWGVAAIGAFLLVTSVFSAIGLIFVRINAKILLVFSIIGAVFGVLSALAVYAFSLTKTYAYAFVPYILATEPEVTATDALRVSMERTKGLKMQMFLADLVFSAGLSVTFSILVLLCRIPFAGGLFAIATIAAFIVVLLFGGIFSGLYKASFYSMAKNGQND